MTDIVVLCPTRGRPDKAAEMIASFRETVALFATQIVLVVDRDDPAVLDYLRIPALFTEAAGGSPLRPPDRPSVMVLDAEHTGDLTAATNTAAARVWGDDCIIGHVGDDHRFRTPGWDKAIVAALTESGVAYGDDGFWHDQIPTAWFVSSVLPRALGWLALPLVHHYGIDNAWRELGRGLGRLAYLPGVHIEHPPLAVRVAEADETFTRAQRHRRSDQLAFYAWRDSYGLETDLARLRGALEAIAA